MRARRTTAALLSLGLVIAACGSDGDATTASLDDVSQESPLAPVDDDRGSDRDDSADAFAGDPVEEGDSRSKGPETGAEALPAPAVDGSGSAGAGGDEATSGRSVAPEQQVGLKAGSVDDNEEWEAYLRYRDEFARLGIRVDELSVAGRRMLTVVDGDGLPVHDAKIEVSDGTVLRTGTDGRAVYLGRVNDEQHAAVQQTATVTRGKARATVELGGDRAQTIVLDGAPISSATRLDLLFLIDATGSMDDEIERLKANMVSVAERIARMESAPDVRFGLTHYRDKGDAYVARTVDFTGDVDRFVASLRGVTADGGGDMPEAFNEAFAEAVQTPSWRTDEGVVRLAVLVADAPPHVGRGPSYTDTVVQAAAMGLRVFPIASSGTDDQTEYIFRQVAQASLGRFVFLSYGAGGAAVGDHSNTDEVGYDVLSLDDLVVRLVEEQLAPLEDRQ